MNELIFKGIWVVAKTPYLFLNIAIEILLKSQDAIRLVTRTKKASAAYLQGKLNVSFPVASRLLNRMEELGVVGPMQLGGKAREVLWDESEAEDFVQTLKSSSVKETDEDDFDLF